MRPFKSCIYRWKNKKKNAKMYILKKKQKIKYLVEITSNRQKKLTKKYIVRKKKLVKKS